MADIPQASLVCGFVLECRLSDYQSTVSFRFALSPFRPCVRNAEKNMVTLPITGLFYRLAHSTACPGVNCEGRRKAPRNVYVAGLRMVVLLDTRSSRHGRWSCLTCDGPPAPPASCRRPSGCRLRPRPRPARRPARARQRQTLSRLCKRG